LHSHDFATVRQDRDCGDPWIEFDEAVEALTDSWVKLEVPSFMCRV
jgi:hypothetical protein